MLLKDKTAIITGTNRGIGKAILEKFAVNGANVFAHARKRTNDFEASLIELKEKYNVRIYPVYFDARNDEEIKEAVKSITGLSRKIDILVNNIGSIQSVKLFHMTSMQTIKEEFDINFFSQMLFIQYISRIMLRNKTGSIINISSCAGLDGNNGMLEYVSSKGAMIAATKRLAIELGAYNIRVNSVAPGLTDTDMARNMKEDLVEETLRKLVFKRKAKPEEIADAVLFFACDMSSFITGQVLRVDGGMLN